MSTIGILTTVLFAKTVEKKTKSIPMELESNSNPPTDEGLFNSFSIDLFHQAQVEEQMDLEENVLYFEVFYKVGSLDIFNTLCQKLTTKNKDIRQRRKFKCQIKAEVLREDILEYCQMNTYKALIECISEDNFQTADFLLKIRTRICIVRLVRVTHLQRKYL